MATKFYPSNPDALILDVEVNLNLAGDEILFLPLESAARLRFIGGFVDNISVSGTLSVVPIILIDDGTDGQNITASKTLTAPVENQGFALAAATQPYVVTGATRNIRLKKSTIGVGQATTFRARSNGIATLTTAAPHGFVGGDKITVASVGGTGYNGEVTVISAPTTTTFTYANAGANETSTADTAGRVGGYLARIVLMFA